MTFFSRLALLAAMILSTTASLTETADAKWIPIFKCRQKPAEEAEACPAPAPAPKPTCCPAPDPEPAPCCAAPETAPEPATCCAAPEPAPCCPEPAPVCEVSAPEPVAPAPPCCCCTAMTEAPEAEAAPTEPVPTEAIPEVAAYGMPELAEGEVLVSISPIETPTEEISTLTSAPTE